MVAVVLHDSVIGDNRINRPCATYCRLPLKRDSLANVNVSCPMKGSRWQRDRVTVYCQRVVNGLNVRRRAIGLINRGLGVLSEKGAPEQSTKNPCSCFH